MTFSGAGLNWGVDEVHDLEWVDLGGGELIVQLDGKDSGEVTEHLGTEWEWDSEEYGVLTDEDGTVTEWVTLVNARRRSLTATPDLQAA